MTESHTSQGSSANTSLAALRRFTQKRAAPPQKEEHCELCGTAVGEVHRHLVDLSRQALLCACDACAILFANQGAAQGKYMLVPRRHLALPDFQISDEQWDALMIPVNMVYIYYSTPAGRAIAFYPGPAGATQSLLDLESWQELRQNNPILQTMETDVEALLINRTEKPHTCYIVPIDACYQLVGLIRLHWKGLHGGSEVWEAIRAYFADIQQKAQPAEGAANAGSSL
jgi:hypothetical protein